MKPTLADALLMPSAATVRAAMGKTIAVIPDVHLRPFETRSAFDRIHAAGKWIAHHRPDYVVIIGDLEHFGSLQTYDGGTARDLDGEAVNRDIEAFKAGLKALTETIRAANRRHKKAKRHHLIHEPIWIFCSGNHEEFWLRWKATKLRGHDFIQKLVEAAGMHWIPFLETAWIENVGFSHYQKSGTKKQAASIQTMLRGHRSFVVGHEHVWDMRRERVYGGGHITVIKAGCFKAPDDIDHDAGEWSGLTLLTDVRDGSFGVQQHSYDQVLEAFGEGDYAQELRARRAQYVADMSAAGKAFS